MNWTQLRVSVKTEDIDRVAAIMSMLDNGIQIEDYSDIETDLRTCYGDLIDENILNADRSHGAVSIYVPDDKNYNDYIAFLKDRFAAEKIDAKTELLGVDEEEWSTAWKKYYHPVKVGEKLVIVPMSEKSDKKPEEIIVRMDPGMAFGTGTHETTRLVCPDSSKNTSKKATTCSTSAPAAASSPSAPQSSALKNAKRTTSTP